MKARAWVFAILFGMISLVGFGQSTSDLTQNSTSEIIYGDVDIGSEIVDNQLVLVEVFKVTDKVGTMEVQHFKQSDCEYLKYSNYIEENVDLVDRIQRISESNFVHISKPKNLKTNLKTDTYTFRSPRDAFRRS